ncbi:protein translation factor, putative [Acanthamoeba castellanii str. Neff]|uniref:Protein translation factor, putative n=1 Tax=Acanthamoeba castellanii (strain ATCC 30010 / Neff) TaxID=1257118 RepID=L8GHP9_ACACF|nr:protein translation factor, putative [Acanthamoeba castellanii str. Neff]ELR12384.1 protein translation factor, putative [Acanthamoeba castellanii str. Neff]
MTDILNLGGRFDPEAELKSEGKGGEESYVHLRIQKRNGKKSVTTIQGIPKKHIEKVLKALRKQLCCNGTVIESEEYGQVIQLQGDQREKVKEFIIGKGIVSQNAIKVHGF